MSVDKCKYNLSNKKDQSTQLPSQSILHIFCWKTFFCASYTQLLVDPGNWLVLQIYNNYFYLCCQLLNDFLTTSMPVALVYSQDTSNNKHNRDQNFHQNEPFFHNVDHGNKWLLSLLQNKKEKKYFLSKNCIQIKFM